MAGNQKWVARRECYVCGRWQMTCFLHRPMSYCMSGSDGSSLLSDSDLSAQEEAKEQRVIKIGGSFESLMMGDGEYWNGFEMMSIQDFIKIYDPTYVAEDDYTKGKLVEVSKTDPGSPTVAAAVQQRERRRKIREQYVADFAHKVKSFIAKHSSNDLSQFYIVPNNYGEEEEITLDLKVFTDYVKPTCKVEVARGSRSSRYATFVPLVRQKEFIVQQVELDEERAVTEEKPFYKDQSVFKKWREDTPALLDECARLDFKHWKVPKFCKDEEDVDRCKQVIRDHYMGLKHIYVSLISTDEFPAIGWMTFTRFCEAAGFIHKVNCSMAAIDTMFVATNFEEEAMDDNPDRSLCRYEFMEILCRIADHKYKKKMIVDTLAEAVEKLIHECIFKNFTPGPWQSWREEFLWNYDVSDVFEANTANIKKLYKKCTELRGKGGEIAKQKTLEMVTKDSQVNILLKEAYYCLGMSKMTVKDERVEAYNVLKLVEFTEYIGRIAAIRYQDDEYADLGLAKKIERTLDLILPFYGMKRKPTGDPNRERGPDNESEESIDMNELDPELTLFAD